MNTSPEKENFSVPISSQVSVDDSEPGLTTAVTTEIITNNTAAAVAAAPSEVNSMTSKTIDEISNRVEEVFAKLQRNLEHNTRVFQEKSQGLLGRIDQAEEQIRKVLAQLESSVSGSSGSGSSANSSSETTKQQQKQQETAIVAATESIALSEESTRMEAEETIEN